MKKTASALFAAILLAAAGLMLSCKSQGGTGDFNNAGGKPYEIVVSIDQEFLERRSGRHAPFDTARTRSDVQSGGTAVRHFACQSGRPQRPHPAPPQHPHHTAQSANGRTFVRRTIRRICPAADYRHPDRSGYQRHGALPLRKPTGTATVVRDIGTEPGRGEQPQIRREGYRPGDTQPFRHRYEYSERIFDKGTFGRGFPLGGQRCPHRHAGARTLQLSLCGERKTSHRRT